MFHLEYKAPGFHVAGWEVIGLLVALYAV